MADYRPYGGRRHLSQPYPGRSYGEASRMPPAAPPAGANRSRRRTLRTALLWTLVPLLALAGAGAWVWLVREGPERDGGTPTAATTRSLEGRVSPTTYTLPAEVRFVRVGECLRNESRYFPPRFALAPCGPNTYEVLARFDGATDGEADAKNKCSTVPGYTDWYFFKTELSALDYVLCLRWR